MRVWGYYLTQETFLFAATAPSFETGFGPFYLFKGTEGRLECNPKAAPWPSEYKWYKGTTLLTSSPPLRIEHREFSVLIIENVVKNRDEGPYTYYGANCSHTHVMQKISWVTRRKQHQLQQETRWARLETQTSRSRVQGLLIPW